MKNLFLLFAISGMFLSIQMQAQNTAVIAADKMNVLYVGIENPISVAVPGVPNDKVTVSIVGATIKKGENGKYIISNLPAAAENSVVIVTVLANGQLSGKTEFRVMSIPDPIPVIPNYSFTGQFRMTKEELLKAGQVGVLLSSPLDEVKYSITSFTISVNESGILKEFQCKGNKFSNNAVNSITKAGKDQKFYFENIKANSTDGAVRLLPSFVVTIIE